MKILPLIGGIVFLSILQGCASFVSPGGIADRNCVGIIECSEEPEIIELPTHEKLLKPTLFFLKKFRWISLLQTHSFQLRFHMSLEKPIKQIMEVLAGLILENNISEI